MKIKFCGGIGKGMIMSALGEGGLVEESEEPEYVVCSPQTLPEALKYRCVRIWISGENVRPDFNLVDYAIGFDDIHFGDRYLQLPLYAFGYKNAREKALKKHEGINKEAALNREFCAWIASNGAWAAREREEIYQKLSEYKRVNSGGAFMNNLPEKRTVPRGSSLSFYEKHKFVLALENSSTLGYTTEKIIEAWGAQTIPIYWGDPDIESIFNKDAFINANRFQSWDCLLDEVRKIDQDDDRYLEMLRAPILLPESKGWTFLNENYTKAFLKHIFLEQTPQKAFRRNGTESNYWASKAECDAKELYCLRKHPLAYRLIRKLIISDEL